MRTSKEDQITAEGVEQSHLPAALDVGDGGCKSVSQVNKDKALLVVGCEYIGLGFPAIVAPKGVYVDPVLDL